MICHDDSWQILIVTVCRVFELFEDDLFVQYDNCPALLSEGITDCVQTKEGLPQMNNLNFQQPYIFL